MSSPLHGPLLPDEVREWRRAQYHGGAVPATVLARRILSAASALRRAGWIKEAEQLVACTAAFRAVPNDPGENTTTGLYAALVTIADNAAMAARIMAEAFPDPLELVVEPTPEDTSTMGLPAGPELAYHVWNETRYANVIPRPLPSLLIELRGKAQGNDWSFWLTEMHVAGPVLQLEMVHNSYAALTQAPEVFAALAQHQPRTLADARMMLDKLGAVDVTDRADRSAGGE